MKAAGYSGTPLAKKLGIVEGMRIRIDGSPPGYREALALPPGVSLARQADPATRLVHHFVRDRAQLASVLAAYRAILAVDAAVWISWPKKASKVATDVTEDVVREVASPLGYVDVKVCAVDETWSALKLVVRRELR